jgi:superfamily I DNA/RNA helicase
VFTLYQTKAFERDLRHLPDQDARNTLPKTVRFLEENPRGHQPSLQTTPLHRASGTGYEILHSRVNDSYRIAWRYEGPTGILLLHVGDHRFIDELATFRETDIAPLSGLGGPWEPSEKETPAPISRKEAVSYRITLFGGCKRSHLELLGVPECHVEAVQSICDIEEVYDLDLPDYAVKNLVDVYLLRDAWKPDRLWDSSTIFYRSNADQLEGYCKGEIKKLLLNLSSEQEKLARLQTTGPTLVRGVAGSGKTTVGVHRAIEQSGIRTLFDKGLRPNVLFVTYTQTLARVVTQMFEELFGRKKAKAVDVWVFHEWLSAYLVGNPAWRPLADSKEMDQAISKGIALARKAFPQSRLYELRSTFFRSEIADVIKGRNLRNWEQYAVAERVGRKRGLREEERCFVWKVYDEYQAELARLGESGKLDYQDLALLALEAIPKDSDFLPYDAVILDEAQDLRPVELQVVSQLAGGPNARNLVLLADPDQSIYYRGIPWKEGNITIAGARSFALRRNYRNTQQILKAAWSLADGRLGDDPDDEIIRPELSDRYGPLPQVVRCMNERYGDLFIVQTIRYLCGGMTFRPGDVAVLGRLNATVQHLAECLCGSDIPSVHFRDEAFDIFENNVKVITLNSAKGLEFPVVFLAHMDEGELPRRIPMADPEEHDLEMRNERRLCYVGLTRAAHRLYIVCTEGAASSFLAEIDPQTIRTVHYEGARTASMDTMLA